MYRNLSDALNLLHPDVTATISFQGFMICCFEGTSKFKVGIPLLEDHEIQINIFEVPRSVDNEDPTNWPPARRLKYPGKNILFEEVDQNGKEAGCGVTVYKHFDSPFSRVRLNPSTKELRDFRWIVDLNGEEFHNRALEPHNLNGIGSFVSINSGTAYTQAVSTEVLFSRDEEGRLKLLGRVGYRMGVDITASDVRMTVKDDSGGETYKEMWSRQDDRFYFIQITNTCHIKPGDEVPEKTAGKSDFSLFYDYLKDPVIPHRRYDLQECIDSTDEPNPRLDGFPDACLPGFGGGSDYFEGQNG